MMYENFDTRTDARWLAPVWIRVGSGVAEAVRSPSDALEKLVYRWPSQKGMHYSSAKSYCIEALSQRHKLDASREAFIRAAIEAKMLD
ncbi:DUF982 domain-containing protein [Rhizobium sp.]|uniref:DUF982 domain-containing protein n=2 Tax=Rhizobium/Agrobacterium group TaxID=227290 RepID=UPI003916D659